MELHKKIKVHHHVSIWLVSALAVLAMGSVYQKQVAALAEDGGAGRPSESTRKFFGESGDSGKSMDNSTPAECAQQNASEDASFRAKVEQQNQLLTQSSALKQQLGGANTPEQNAAIQAQIDALQQQINALGVTAGDRSQQKDSGPTGACMAAIVKQQKSRFETMRGEFGKHVATLAKVSTTVDKIEAKIPELEAAGVDKAIIDKIKADIALIRTDIEKMKSFFASMQSTVDDFLAVADSDPDAAFTKMKAQFGRGEQNSAGKNADALIAAFADIQKNVDGLK